MPDHHVEVQVTPYTQGVWQVKPGSGEDFVTAWTEFARWTQANVAGARWATLLRDLEDPNRYVTIGPWDSVEAINRWRNLDGWGERVAKIRELLDGFQPSTLEAVLELDE
jgi:heme-degrading monooxygenase HmoA